MMGGGQAVSMAEPKSDSPEPEVLVKSAFEEFEPDEE